MSIYNTPPAYLATYKRILRKNERNQRQRWCEWMPKMGTLVAIEQLAAKHVVATLGHRSPQGQSQTVVGCGIRRAAQHRGTLLGSVLDRDRVCLGEIINNYSTTESSRAAIE
ncbi:hypothetical protein MCOR25_001638 [Pyricularia grisea]|nr:hypothetical protein MCOR25_001638 [Pyricularia grisea]